MKAYVVRDWKSKGIVEVEGERFDAVVTGDAKAFRTDKDWYWWGSEVVATFVEAQAKVLWARDRRIASLEKQIAALKAMTFEQPGGES